MIRFYCSTSKELLQPAVIHRLLKEQFWSKEIPLEYVERFIKHSLCFGGYLKSTNEQVGFIRVISDYTTYAYMTDLVVSPKVKGEGLGRELVRSALNHPELQGLKTWSCRCTDQSRAIFKSEGFTPAVEPETIVERENLNIYTDPGFKNLFKKDVVQESNGLVIHSLRKSKR